MNRFNNRRGVSMADLLVVLVVLVFVSGVGVAWAQSQREIRNRVNCLSNLRQIGQAIFLYANENRQQWPRVHTSPDLEAHPLTAFTDPEADNPLAMDEQTDQPLAGQEGDGGAPAYNDVTAALFQLVRTQDIGTEVFICPSTIYTKDTLNNEPAVKRSNFSSKRNLSYSVATPYPSAASAAKGYRWNVKQSPEFVVAADLNPGKRATDITDPQFVHTAPEELLRKGNSPNQNGDGQNALYGDGHVEFCRTPFGGWRRDNIYTMSASSDGLDTTSARQFDGRMSPAHQHDSILWLVADEDTFDAEKADEPLTEEEQADSRPRLPTQAYFTVDDGQTWFADDIDRIVPFEHEG